jgi:hypothetical protein
MGKATRFYVSVRLVEWPECEGTVAVWAYPDGQTGSARGSRRVFAGRSEPWKAERRGCSEERSGDDGKA